MDTRPLGPAIALLLILIAALLTGGRAEAHAALVATEPAAGAVVGEAPAEAILEFSEPVRPLTFRWFPPDGAPPVEAAPRHGGEQVTVPLPPDAAEGTLLLSWRVVSADGHPVGGSFAFSIGAASATSLPEANQGGARAAAAARGVLTLALVFGVGGAVFCRLVAREARGGRLAGLAAALALPAAALSFGLNGADLIGGGPGSLATAAPWAAALVSPVAPMAGTAAVAALLALAALRGGPAWFAALGWAAASVSFALFGHAATAAPRWLTAPSVAIHASAFLFWIGALPELTARAIRSDVTPLLHRFSALAIPLVALLVLSGAALAVVQIRTPAALLETAYGRLLLIKLGFVAVLLALAALNRFRLTPAIDRGAPGAAMRFRRSAATEVLLGLVILGLASGFRLTPPPRALVAAAPEAYVYLHGPEMMADVTLAPGRAGPNSVKIALTTAEGTPAAPAAVMIAFADPARGIEPIRAKATREGAVWTAGPVQLPGPGAWTVRLDVLVSDFELARLEAVITLAQ